MVIIFDGKGKNETSGKGAATAAPFPFAPSQHKRFYTYVLLGVELTGILVELISNKVAI
ncbi:hypothetical protein HQN89_35660 [Paenibacillus frigoriresistens]|uniref:hypothetical protein n=1 Tax=Paenibacillus alginolyticus TaxID=59839 RepID=UPI001567B132|nr:hypothetical protein [Paenibacillus frigoriresistens]NRF96135.1 hypothetical protein [Paenibacillus frigoriresistens]